MAQIDLNPQIIPGADPNLIDLGSTTPQFEDPNIAAARALKAHAGLQDYIDMPYDQIFSQIYQGNEPEVRKDIANKVDQKKAEDNQKEILRIVGNDVTKRLTPEEGALITQYTQFTPTDPNTVFESTYGKAYYNYIEQTNITKENQTDLGDGHKYLPSYTAALKARGEDALTRREVIMTHLQKAAKATGAQSWFDWGIDQFKSVWPIFGALYWETKLRGLVPTQNFKLLRSDFLEAQRRALYDLPISEFHNRLSAITEKLINDNPSAAVEFLQYMLGQSTDDKVLNNFFQAVNTQAFAGEIAIASKLIKNANTALKISKQIKQVAKEGPKTKGQIIDTAEGPRDVNEVMDNIRDSIMSQLKGAEKSEGDVGVALDQAGAVEESAIVRAAETALDRVVGKDDPLRTAISQLTSSFRTQIQELGSNGGLYGREMYTRLVNRYVASLDAFLRNVKEIQNVERIPLSIATEKAMRELKQILKNDYVGAKNSILDIEIPLNQPRIGNTYDAYYIFGKPDASIWGSQLQAWNGAVTNHFREFETIRHGNGWVYRVKMPFKETELIHQKGLLRTSLADTPGIEDETLGGIFHGWLAKYKTPEKTLSEEQNIQRKIAVYAPNAWFEFIKDQSRAFTDLKRGVSALDEFGEPVKSKYNPWKAEKIWVGRKKRWDRFKTMIDQEIRDPITDEKGYFFPSIDKYEEYYRRKFGENPMPIEIEAYFAFKRVYEMDAMLRDLEVRRNKWRAGVQEVRFSVKDPEGNLTPIDWLEGAIHGKLPRTDDTVFFPGSNFGGGMLGRADTLPAATRSYVDKQTQLGKLRVLDLWDKEKQLLNRFERVAENDALVRYVVLPNNYEQRPIGYTHLPRKGGGHYIPDYENYIKQARVHPELIGRRFNHVYLGDTTVMPIANRAMGAKIAAHLDQVRQLIKAKNEAGAETYYRQSSLPMDWHEVRSWFKESHDPNGVKVPPRLNLNETIQVINRRDTILGKNTDLPNKYRYVDKKGNTVSTFKDGTKRGSLARQYSVEFTQERDAYDLMTINDYGHKNNPLYKYEPAKYIDPITTMNRGLIHIINSHFLDDYKIFTVNNLLREAERWIDASPEDINASPFWYYNNLKESLVKNIEPARKAYILNVKAQADQLMGVKSDLDEFIYSATQKLADTIYTNLGPSNRVGIIANDLLPKIKDAPQFIRSMAFHAKLGVFAIPQLLVQAQTFSMIQGIAGSRFAVPGSVASLATIWTRINKHPEVIDHMDTLLSKLNIPGISKWRPGEFKEALSEFKKTGMAYVQSEVAQLDNPFNMKIIQSGVHRFLDSGLFFFREGERSVRYGAWYTAYKEFRDAHPHAPITDRVRSELLKRADFLYINMSRASSSALHKGILAFPSQFLAYQLRVMEMMVGKRLTPMQKARTLAWNAALYGFPTSLGVSGLPVYDTLRKWSIQEGYVPDAKHDPWNTLIQEGLPSFIISLITGRTYNIGDRYGVQGFTSIDEALRNDTNWWRLIGGAAFSNLADIYQGTNNFTQAMISLIADRGETFPFMFSDVVDNFKFISSVNNGWKFLSALHTGRLISKRGQYLSSPDLGVWEALLMATTGLQPQAMVDAHIKGMDLQTQHEMEKWGSREFSIQYRRGLEAFANKDYNLGKKYMSRARRLLEQAGVPENHYPDILSKAIKGQDNVIDSINWGYVNNAPDSEYNKRLKALGVIQRQQQEQKQR